MDTKEALWSRGLMCRQGLATSELCVTFVLSFGSVTVSLECSAWGRKVWEPVAPLSEPLGPVLTSGRSPRRHQPTPQLSALAWDMAGA